MNILMKLLFPYIVKKKKEEERKKCLYFVLYSHKPNISLTWMRDWHFF